MFFAITSMFTYIYLDSRGDYVGVYSSDTEYDADYVYLDPAGEPPSPPVRRPRTPQVFEDV